MGPTESRRPSPKYHKVHSIGANNPRRPSLPPWWLSSSSESRSTLGGNEMGEPSLSQRPLVVWCCLSPENVSVGPRSQSSPVLSVALPSLYTQRFASILHHRIRRPCSPN